MAKVLGAVINQHFEKDSQTTVLVITDGEPNSTREIFEILQNFSAMLASADDLSLTFIQIGNDEDASRFLEQLKKDNDCVFPIVDCISYVQFQEMRFSDFIAGAINHQNSL